MARWSNGTGRRALDATLGPVPPLLGRAAFGVGDWREVAEAAERHGDVLDDEAKTQEHSIGLPPNSSHPISRLFAKIAILHALIAES